MFVFVLLLINIFPVIFAADFNDESIETCLHPSGIIGYCLNITQCPSVIPEIQERKHPHLCRFEGKNPIFCCKGPPPEINLKLESDIFNSEPNQEQIKNRLQGNQFASISAKKCFEYYGQYEIKKDGYYLDQPAQLLKNRFGGDNVIVGGTKAFPREFLHMAAIGYGNEDNIQWNCEGALISEKYVLTAAHCLFDHQLAAAKYIRLGDVTLNSKKDEVETQDLRVARRTKHPDYRSKTYYHDIGLIELDRPAVMNSFVRPACLYTSDRLEPSSELIESGWGQLESVGEASNHLHKFYLNLFENSTCTNFFTEDRRLKHGVIDGLQMCAGSNGEDVCIGNSGSILQVLNDDYYSGYKIVGISTVGKSCKVGNAPGIYTRVSAYIPWIESIVWPDSKIN